MELQRLLEHYVYGAPPARGFTARVTKTLDGVCGDRGVLHEIELTLDGLEAPDAPRIRLALFLPADATSRVPLFLGLNRCANHTVVADAAPTIIERRWLHAARSQGAPRGGCALSRANDQETVERITRVCPRWFDGRFRAFADDGARLPLDQHLLALLVAPQPVLETVGLQGTWANDARSLRGLRAAAPVWELLGAPPSPPGGARRVGRPRARRVRGSAARHAARDERELPGAGARVRGRAVAVGARRQGASVMPSALV